MNRKASKVTRFNIGVTIVYFLIFLVRLLNILEILVIPESDDCCKNKILPQTWCCAENTMLSDICYSVFLFFLPLAGFSLVCSVIVLKNAKDKNKDMSKMKGLFASLVSVFVTVLAAASVAVFYGFFS